MGGTTVGNYTLGRPLVAGLIAGIIMGDIQSGILVGAAIQVVYIALVTSGGTVSTDVRAVSYIGIPLAVLAIKSQGIDPGSTEAAGMAASLGAAVGTLGTMIVGVTAGLEEARANGEAIDDDAINGIRAGLMGPLAGLGDSLIVGTLIPILLGIALGLSTGGSPLGAIFYIVAWNLIMFFGMKFAYNQGYELGGKAVEALVGPKAKALRDSIVMVGTVVIGAVGATWVSITCSPNLKLPGGGKFQDALDGIYPHLLPMAFIIFCWYMMTKKKVNPVVMMLILVVIAFVGVLVGFFDPALRY